MATSKKQINVAAFDALSKQVGEVYDKLSALDAKLDGSLLKKFSDLAKGVNQFSNAFLNLRSVKIPEITESVAKIQKMFEEIDKLSKVVSAASVTSDSTLIKFANSLYRFVLALRDVSLVDLSDNPLKKIGQSIVEMVNSLKETRSISVQLTKFQAVVSSLQDIAKIASGVGRRSIADLENVRLFTQKFVQVAGELSKTKTDSVDFAQFDKTLNDFAILFKTFQVVFSGAKPTQKSDQTILQSFEDFKKFITGALSFSKGLQALTPSTTQQFDSFIEIVKLYGTLYETFSRTLATTGSTPALPANADSGSTTTTSAAQFLSEFKQFQEIISSVMAVVKKLPKVDVNFSNLESIRKAFAQILEFYQSFSALVKQSADDSTATLTASLLRGLGSLVEGVGSFFASRSSKGLIGSVVDLFVFRTALGQTVNAMKSIISIVGDLDTSRVEAVGQFAKGVGSILDGLSTFFKLLTKADIFDLNPIKFVSKLIQVRAALIPINQVLNSLRPIFKAADKGDVTAIAAFTTAIGAILNSIGELFKTFAQRENNASYGTIAKVFVALSAALRPVNGFVKTLKSLPKDVNFTGLDALFLGLGSLVEQVSKISDKSSANFNAKALKTQVKQIGELLSFKGFKNIGKNSQSFTAAAAAVNSISALFDTIDRLGVGSSLKSLNDLNDIDFSWLSNLAREFSRASSFLRGITPGEIVALETVAKSLSAFSNIEKLKNGSNLDLRSTIKSGIIDATIEIGVFKTAINALSSALGLLNPANVVSFFGSVASAAARTVEQLKNVFASIAELGSNIKTFGTDLISNFGIGNLTNSGLFTAAVEFDKLGSSLEVFGGLSKEQRKEAEAFANTIGKDYPLSANEALSATLDLIKAGQDLNATRSILPAAADLASLSDSGSIENATKFIIQATAAFKQFNDTVPAGFENAATAVDIIAAAADSSTASVEGLSEGLANVGPVAAGFGLTLEETSAALAIFTDGGIGGAEAGTQLKSLLTNLTTTTARAELNRLGVSLTDQAGNFRSLNDIVSDLSTTFNDTRTVSYRTNQQFTAQQQEQLKIAERAYAASQRQQFLIGNDLNAAGLGENADKKMEQARQISENALATIANITGSAQEAQYITAQIQRTEQQNAESLKKIAGSYGQSGLAILLAEGEDGLNSFITQMQGVEPASVRARKALDNLAGDMIQLQGSVETLGTKALLPLLEKIFRPLVQVGRLVVDSFLQINDSVLEFITTALALSSLFATVLGGVAVFSGAMIQLGGVVGGLVITFSQFYTLGIIGAVTGFAAGLATLVAAATVLVPIVITVTTAFETLFKIFSTNAGDAADQLQNLIGRVGQTIGLLLDAFEKIGTFIGAALGGSNVGALDAVGARIAGFFNSISLQITKFQTSGAGRTLIEIGQIFEGFTKALTFDAGAAQAANDALSDAAEFENLGSDARNARRAQEAREAFSKEYADFITDLVNRNRILKSVLGENLNAEDVQAYFRDALAYVSVIRARIGDVLSSFGQAFAAARDVFNGENGSLGGAIKAFVATLSGTLNTSLGDLTAVVLRALSALFNFDTGTLAQVFDAQGFSAGLGQLVTNAVLGAKQYIINNRDSIKDLVMFLFNSLVVSGISALKGLADALGLEGIANVLGNVLDVVRSVFGGFVDTLFNLLEGQDFSTALLNAFGPGIQPLLELGQELKRTIGLILDTLSTLASALFGDEVSGDVSKNSFIEALNGIISSFTDFVAFFNDNVLSFLSQGDFSGLAKNIGTLLFSAVKNGVTAFVDFVKAIDYAEVFRTVSAALKSLFTAIVEGFRASFDTSALQAEAKNFDLTGFILGLLDQLPAVIKDIAPTITKYGALFLQHFSSIFNFTEGNFSTAFFKEFDVNRFALGLRDIIKRLISSVVKLLKTSANTIKPFVVNFFSSFFTGGLSFAKFISDFFGFEGLSNILGGVITTIKDVFGTVFDLIVGIVTGNGVGATLVDVLGPQFEAVGQVIDAFIAIVDSGISLVRDLIDALFAPGGTGESPLATALTSVTSVLARIPDLIQNSFLAPLLAGDIGTAFSNLSTGVLGIITDLAGALSSILSDTSLFEGFKAPGQLVVDGFIAAVGAALGTIGEFFGFDTAAFIGNLDRILTSAVDGIAGGGLANLFPSLVGTVINLLINGIGLGVSAIADLVGFDASLFLTSLDNIINNNILAIGEGGGGLFQITIGTITGLLGTALGGIFDAIETLLPDVDLTAAFGNITDSLQNFVDTVTNVFTGNDDGVTILDNLATILLNIVSGFEQLIALVPSKGLIESVLNVVINFASSLGALALDTVTDFIAGIDDIVTALAQLDPVQLGLLAVALGAIAGYVFGGVILTALGAGFSALAAGLSAVIVPLYQIGIPLLVFSQALRAVSQNITGFMDAINTLLDGDIGNAIGDLAGALTNTLVDTGFNLFKLLGFDTILGQSREEIKKVADMLGVVIGAGAQFAAAVLEAGLFAPINEFLGVTLPLLFSELERLGSAGKAALGDEGAQAMVDTFAAIDTIAGKTKAEAGEGEKGFTFDFGSDTERFKNFEDTVVAGGTPAQRRLAAQAARNFDKIFQQAIIDYGNNADAPPEVRNAIMDNIARFYNLTGQTPQVLAQALKNGNQGFFNDLISSMVMNGATAADFGPDFQAQIAGEITKGFSVLVPDLALDKVAQLQLTIDTLASLGLDTTYLQAERDRLQAQIDTFLQTGEVPTTEVTTDVNANVGDTTVTGTDKVDTAVQDSVTGDGTPQVVNKDVVVRPNVKRLDEMGDSDILTPEQQLAGATQQAIPGFDTSALTNPEQVAGFNSLVSELQANVSQLAIDLNALTGTQTVVTTALATMQTSITTFRDQTVPMFAAVSTAITPIETALTGISNRLLLLTIEFPAAAIAAVGSMLTIGGGLLALAGTFTATLTPAIQKVKDLAAALRDAAAAAQALGGGTGITITVSGVGGGGGVGAGRAEGGKVVPGLLYPFLEKGQPETVTIGSNTYLAVPQGGMVTPLSALTSAAATGLFSGPFSAQTNTSQPAQSTSTTTIGDTNFSFGDINAGGGVQGLVSQLSRVIDQKMEDRNNDLAGKLRSNRR